MHGFVCMGSFALVPMHGFLFMGAWVQWVALADMVHGFALALTWLMHGSGVCFCLDKVHEVFHRPQRLETLLLPLRAPAGCPPMAAVDLTGLQMHFAG